MYIIIKTSTSRVSQVCIRKRI